MDFRSLERKWFDVEKDLPGVRFYAWLDTGSRWRRECVGCEIVFVQKLHSFDSFEWVYWITVMPGERMPMSFRIHVGYMDEAAMGPQMTMKYIMRNLFCSLSFIRRGYDQ